MIYTTAGTPYEGGIFKMKLVLPKEFPASPPLGIYTHVYHLYRTNMPRILVSECVNISIFGHTEE